MPGSATFNFGAYVFDTGTKFDGGVAKEDLLEQITNISPYDTPFVSQAPKVGCRHIYHQWLQDSLAAVGTVPNTLTGAVEGADWSYDATTAATREFNVTMILRKDLGLSESQRAVDVAGFADQYAYEVQKAGKELAIKLERLCFGDLSTSTGASGTARVMRGLQNFIATNTAFAGAIGGTVGDATHDGIVTVGDFNEMLNSIYVQGGNPEQVYVSPRVKRQVSAFTVPGAAAGSPHARNIAAVDKKLVGAIDFYDSDFGLIQIVLDRWVPESTNSAGTTATGSATNTGGQMFFLSRAINRIAWLRPVHHELIGKRGDSVAGYVVGECTLEVLAEKANGRIKSVNNRSAVS